MKIFILTVIMVCGLKMYSEETNVIFPILLSNDNAALMTNAEYRCTIGRRIAFDSTGVYKVFDATNISTNVLIRLGFSIDGLAKNQAIFEAKKRVEAENFKKEQEAIAYRHYQNQVAAERAAAIRSAENARNVAEMQRQNGRFTISRTMITGGDAISGYTTQTITTSP